jgi:hypothetical protein
VITETITFNFETEEQQRRFHARLKQRDITKEELKRCKRATVVLAECFKAAMGGKQAPLELREDMRTLTQVLRSLEAIAK